MRKEQWESDRTTLHVLELPQIYTKPTAEELLATLALLTSGPPSWEASDTEDDEMHMAAKSQSGLIDPTGLGAYLTKIISSDLRWIEDDSVREDIWKAASIRLSERSGRTAMGSLVREFRVPVARNGPSEDIVIHEPALTADNLGLKTWASSYLLSRRLWRLVADENCLSAAKDLPPHSVLELGSGTGLVGLTAAMVLGTDVLLTDLPAIVGNLHRNALSNEAILAKHSGSVRTAILNWATPWNMEQRPNDAAHETGFQESHQFRIIFVADPVYSPDHPGWLVQTISARLAREEVARVVVELPLRSAYQPQVEDFLRRMQASGLAIFNEGYETGYDDWGSDGERKAVRCWWTAWGWDSACSKHDDKSHQRLSDEFRQLLD